MGDGQYYTIQAPERSEWTCTVLHGLTWTPEKGKEPSAFHRWMQETAFGVKWTKTPPQQRAE